VTRLVRRLPLILSILGALAAILLALAAGPLGVDEDQKWGPFRIGLLILGLCWLAGLGGLRLVDALDRRLLAKHALAPAAPLHPAVRAPATSGRPFQALGVLLFLIAVELLYSWYASASLMTRWPSTSQVYSLLADALSHGRTDLQIDPPRELANIGNPYDPAQRQGIAVYADASYFRGRYYAYWGPAPAIPAALLKAVFRRPVGDEYIAFAASSVGLLFLTLMILRLHKLSFPGLPPWLLWATLAVVAVAHPILWNLSDPGVYEAAINWGQAFLLAGLFCALPIIDGSKESSKNLVLAGSLWGLAIASRFTLVIAVGVLTIGTVAGLNRTKRRFLGRGGWLHASAALALPLAVVVAVLGAYNYLRFGNVAETGLQFQMQIELDYTRLTDDHTMFNQGYFIPNAIYYSVTPVRLSATFPFLKPARGKLPSVEMFVRNLDVPDVHSVEDISGLLVAAPFVVFSLVFLGRLAPRRAGRATPPAGCEALALDAGQGYSSVAATVILAAILTAVPILAYRHVANRFELDYVPLLVIGSALGAWDLQRANRWRPIRGRLVNVALVTAAAATVVVSILLAVSGPASKIDDYNPTLWRLLTQFRLW